MLIDRAYEMLEPSKSMAVIMYVLQHTDGDTRIFSRTYNQIQKDTGVSQATIAKVFKYMESKGAIEYLGKSRWMNYVVKGASYRCDGPEFYVENKGC